MSETQNFCDTFNTLDAVRPGTDDVTVVLVNTLTAKCDADCGGLQEKCETSLNRYCPKAAE